MKTSSGDNNDKKGTQPQPISTSTAVYTRVPVPTFVGARDTGCHSTKFSSLTVSLRVGTKYLVPG